MSWVMPGEYENEERFERELAIERDEARKILMDSGLVARVEFTNCMIPIQIHAFLPTEEMCYGRNSRVGGNVTMWVFEKECKLAKGWPPALFKGEQVSDATTYIILAQEMLVLIKKYLELKSKENPVAT
ncbi:MAG: hypothetical protein DKT66_26125 [Candidatus Melainabacteria bacterium]|nr:MAG: hypothetical protein DKT66_26125 [Candidatus Melainabacteria bacterium]